MNGSATPGTEPVQRAALDQRVSLPVLGIHVSFESNDPLLVEVAEEAFGAWRVLEQAPRLLSDVRMRFRVYVGSGDEAPVGQHAPLTYHVPDRLRVFLRTPGSMGVADAARRESVLYATRALLADRQHFRYGVLEALTMGVLTRLDRQPLHAACITRGENALLLAGPSGSGKSTLAFAAARAGYKVLSEDYVNVQLEPRLRVWGMPGFLHLPPEAAARFAELEDERPTLMANGKEKIAVNLAAMGAMPALPVAQRAGICVLEPGANAFALETLDSRSLMDALTTRLDPGFDAFADTIGDCVRMLASHGGWKLQVGPDPHKALEWLDSMMNMLEED